MGCVVEVPQLATLPTTSATTRECCTAVEQPERVGLVRLHDLDIPYGDVLEREDSRAPRVDVPRQRRVLDALDKAVEILRDSLRHHRLRHDVQDLLQLLREARLFDLLLLPRRHPNAEHPDHAHPPS